MSGSSDTTPSQYRCFQFASKACILPQHLIVCVELHLKHKRPKQWGCSAKQALHLYTPWSTQNN